MIRLRRGNVPCVGSTSGASSDTTAPPASTIASARRRCAARPEHRVTATDDGDRRATGSDRGLVGGTVDPERQPRDDGRIGRDEGRRDPCRDRRARSPSRRRVPTTATARSRDSDACRPRRYRTCGGIAIAASAGRVGRLLDGDRHGHRARAGGPRSGPRPAQPRRCAPPRRHRSADDGSRSPAFGVSTSRSTAPGRAASTEDILRTAISRE